MLSPPGTCVICASKSLSHIQEPPAARKKSHALKKPRLRKASTISSGGLGASIAAPNLAGNIRPLPMDGPILLAKQSIAKIAQSMCKPLVALRIQKKVGPSGPNPCGPRMDGATCVRRLLPSPSRRSMNHHQMHLDSAVVPLAQTCQRLSERSKRLRTSRVLIVPSKTAGRAHAN